jgi:hypothetical protein
MRGTDSQTTWQRVRGNTLLYVREGAREERCVSSVRSSTALQLGAGAGAGAGAYCVAGLVDHPLPGCFGLASRDSEDSEDSSAPPSTIAAPWLIFVLVTAHRAWPVTP